MLFLMCYFDGVLVSIYLIIDWMLVLFMCGCVGIGIVFYILELLFFIFFDSFVMVCGLDL